MNFPLSWNAVTVAIPTVPERAHILRELLEQVRVACPGAEVMVHEHVPGTAARWDFPMLLEQAAQKKGSPWILQLEDDVVLAPTFGAEAVEIPLDADEVLTLFSRSSKDTEAMDMGRLRRRAPPKSFSMSQAFLIHADLAHGIADFSVSWYAAHPDHNRAADLLLGAYLSYRKAKLFVRLPSLVQHRRLPSTLPGHRGARQSETYRRTFGEVT